MRPKECAGNRGFSGETQNGGDYSLPIYTTTPASAFHVERTSCRQAKPPVPSSFHVKRRIRDGLSAWLERIKEEPGSVCLSHDRDEAVCLARELLPDGRSSVRATQDS